MSHVLTLRGINRHMFVPAKQFCGAGPMNRLIANPVTCILIGLLSLAAMAQIPGTTPGLSPSAVGSNGSLHPAMASGGDDTVYGRSGIRRERWPELAKEAVERNVGTRDSDGNGEVTSGRTTWTRVRRRRLRGGTARNSREVLDKGMERRRCIKEPDSISQPAKGGAR
jgi:hypothetical protein